MTALVTGPVTGSPRQTRHRRRWPAWWMLPAAAALLTGLIMLALAGAALDDAAIDARTGHATAQVLAVTSIRTLVQFTTPDGKIYRPDAGLAYPSGLQVGQLVRVEYDSSDPTGNLRVAGRTWVQGVAPALIILMVLWVLVVPASWWLRRRQARAV
ncbi:MAG TPA: DUF3592 domain-containing protein [Pseudonocardiaceae bacterium]|nr:DUF3592 domain-containing protein [Pseudonocardiaceae bacterium]